MTVIQKAANANAVVSSPGWTNPTNAYADDGTVAAFSGANGTTWSNDYGFPDFTTSDIPDGSTINSVKMIANVWQSSAGRGQCGVQGRDSGANSGAEQTSTSTSTSNLCTATLAGGGVTLADLRSASTVLKARVRCSRTASQAFTGSLDYVYIEVDFTPPAEEHSGPAGDISAASGSTGAGKKGGKAAAGDLSATSGATGAGQKTGKAAASVSAASSESAAGHKTGATGAAGDLPASSSATAAGQKGGRGPASVSGSSTPTAAGKKGGRGTAGAASAASGVSIASHKAALSSHGGSSTLGQDSFTGADGTALTAHTPEVGGPWLVAGGSEVAAKARLLGGMANFEAVASGVWEIWYRLSASLGDGEVTAKVIAGPDYPFIGWVHARWEGSGIHAYMLALDVSGVGQWWLARITTGSWTVIASGDAGTDDHVRLAVAGSSPTGLKGRLWSGAEPGTWDVETTDNTALNQRASGAFGIGGDVADDPAGERIDDFLATGGGGVIAGAGDISAASSTTAAGQRLRGGAAAVSAASGATASGKKGGQSGASASAATSTTGAGQSGRLGAAGTLSAASGTSASTLPGRRAAAGSLSASSSVSAAGRKGGKSAATETASSSTTAAANTARKGAASVSAAVNATATGTASTEDNRTGAAGTISATSSTSAGGWGARRSSAVVTASSLTTAAARKSGRSAVSLSAGAGTAGAGAKGAVSASLQEQARLLLALAAASGRSSGELTLAVSSSLALHGVPRSVLPVIGDETGLLIPGPSGSFGAGGRSSLTGGAASTIRPAAAGRFTGRAETLEEG